VSEDEVKENKFVPYGMTLKLALIEDAMQWLKEKGKVKKSTFKYYLEIKKGLSTDKAEEYIEGLIELGDLTSEINTGTEFIRIVKTTEVSDEKSKEKMVARG